MRSQDFCECSRVNVKLLVICTVLQTLQTTTNSVIVLQRFIFLQLPETVNHVVLQLLLMSLTIQAFPPSRVWLMWYMYVRYTVVIKFVQEAFSSGAVCTQWCNYITCTCTLVSGQNQYFWSVAVDLYPYMLISP